MSSADLRELGSISLLDLDIISKFYGRDFLPYPFMFTRPSKLSGRDDYSTYVRSVPDRFNNADLAQFQQVLGCYANADIRVECHVQYIPADTASVRVVAARHGQLGCLAKQRPDEDVIDVYELSPYALGPAVADAAGLQKPGRHSAIVVPEYAPVADDPLPTDEFSIHQTVENNSPTGASVSRADVTAFSTVQSHWRPTRSWGIDHGKNAAVWVRIKDDGDYLYAADMSEATPVSTSILAERINRLIAEDVKALRHFREG
jgi:hypothetical protein